MPISANTRLLGLLGWPVSHSLSPAMHNAAAAALNLDLVYLPLPVAPAHLEAALRGLVALNFLGVNVTVPHKQAVLPFLETLDPAAQAIRAVNTIKISNPQSPISHSPHSPSLQSPISNPQSPFSQSPQPAAPALHASNTDAPGFLADLHHHNIPIASRDCLVLGAGGSARAVVYALARSGARVTVFARRPRQAQQLVADLQPHLDAAHLDAAAWDQVPDARPHAPLIVNTTPVGMHPHHDQSPWPEKWSFPRDTDVYDLIYNPIETRFMQQARAAGCRAVNGLGMLLHQGALAFETWTGVKPPLDVMAAALRRQGIG